MAGKNNNIPCKNKDLFVRNRDKVSELNNISIYGLFCFSEVALKNQIQHHHVIRKYIVYAMTSCKMSIWFVCLMVFNATFNNSPFGV